MRLTLIKSRTVSQNPTMYMATPTALAKENIKPIAPPNSGPSDLEMEYGMYRSLIMNIQGKYEKMQFQDFNLHFS